MTFDRTALIDRLAEITGDPYVRIGVMPSADKSETLYRIAWQRGNRKASYSLTITSRQTFSMLTPEKGVPDLICLEISRYIAKRSAEVHYT